MSSTISEVGTVHLVDGTRALLRGWKLLLAAAVSGSALGVASASLVQPVWESAANLQIGMVHGQAIEDPRILGRLVESEGFLESVRAALNISPAVALRAQTVETAPGGSAAYLRILASGRTPDEARQVATHAVDLVKTRHARLFESALADHTSYLETLARVSKELEAGISRIESTLERIRPDARDGALAALLLQSQLESKRVQHLQLAKELRDTRVQTAMNSRSTVDMGPPSTPTAPAWPRRPFFTAIGAALALLLAVGAILIFRPRAA